MSKTTEGLTDFGTPKTRTFKLGANARNVYPTAVESCVVFRWNDLHKLMDANVYSGVELSATPRLRSKAQHLGKNNMYTVKIPVLITNICLIKNLQWMATHFIIKSHTLFSCYVRNWAHYPWITKVLDKSARATFKVIWSRECFHN